MDSRVEESVDIAIIGGGQAALSVTYFLQKTNHSLVIIDAEAAPGGAWRHGWNSLRLFSPANWSSLSGWQMPPVGVEYPARNQVIDYLAQYEARYQFPVARPVLVTAVERSDMGLRLISAGKIWRAKAVVSATGTWRHPFIPRYPDAESFSGVQLHSAHYVDAESFAGKKVAIVGGGNSGAQILAEVSKVADCTWVTPREPIFLPDDVDGRVLFERATERWKAQKEGRVIEQPVGGLGDIVMVPPVVEARARGVLSSVRPFVSFTRDGVIWRDGSTEQFDAVIWCTGFRPALDHLAPLNIINDDGIVTLQETRAVQVPGLWLVGYGEWSGVASATIVGISRSARATAEEIDIYLSGPDNSNESSDGK